MHLLVKIQVNEKSANKELRGWDGIKKRITIYQHVIGFEWIIVVEQKQTNRH